ncbi:MAG TPA: cation diffusion facilitator family transporter [Microbacteriaceae bacterium]|nr:cation diffusion facilitator family transporter [Microbacteriaceae bacterium]
MSESAGRKAVLAAFFANLAIAITKFFAAFISGSAAMLAEAVHSVADTLNQLLLLAGAKRAKKAPDKDHPFGYGRVRYLYAFVVAVVLFSVGGVFSIFEGISKFREPHTIEMWWIPIVVLVVAIIIESFSIRVAIRESRPLKGDKSWWEFVKTSKSPELPVVLFEDAAALVGLVFALFGVGLTVITGNGLFDAVATILIGLLLIVVAMVLVIEVSSLLVGEGANEKDLSAIEAAFLNTRGVDRIIHMKTLYMGPDEMMVGAKISISAEKKVREVAAIINVAEAKVRSAVPHAKTIYVEPDVWRDPTEIPLTEEIVLLSSD